MKIALEYPWPVWSNKDPNILKEITLLDISLQTTVYYFKNHDTSFEEAVIKVLGFGIRIYRNEE